MTWKFTCFLEHFTLGLIEFCVAESRPPGKPSYIQLKAFAREIIVLWGSPENSGDVPVQGFRIGYGVVTPDTNWIVDIGPRERSHTLSALGWWQSTHAVLFDFLRTQTTNVTVRSTVLK